MRKWIFYALVIIIPALAGAQTHPPVIGSTNLPTCDDAHEGRIYSLEDASSTTDCDNTGGGDITATCACVEDPSSTFTWVAVGSGGSGTITVEEADASPSVAADTVQFDQDDGFTVTDEGGGQVQIDLSPRAGAAYTHATDCTSITTGVAGDLCVEEDSEALYSCQPTAGGCDTAGEWILTGDGSGSGASAGGTGDVQYSSDGVGGFGAEAEFDYDAATNILDVDRFPPADGDFTCTAGQIGYSFQTETDWGFIHNDTQAQEAIKVCVNGSGEFGFFTAGPTLASDQDLRWADSTAITGATVTSDLQIERVSAGIIRFAENANDPAQIEQIASSQTTLSIADSGDGSPASSSPGPFAASIVRAQCNDADGCTITLSDDATGDQDNMVVMLYNDTSNTITMSDSAGVQTFNGGSWSGGLDDAILLLRAQYDDEWKEISRSNAGGAALGTDTVGTDELDDDANSPTAGDFVIVETGAASFDYVTPNAGTDVTADLEEEGVTCTDCIDLAKLDDDAGTPLAGDLLTVRTGATDVTYTTPNAGTDITADLEEEGQINATTVTGNAADDQVLLGSGASALAYATIPDCNSNNMLTYTQSTNTWGCDADDGAGGGAPTSVQYVVGASDATLTAEKILTDGQGIDTVITGTDAGAATIDLAYTDTLAANPAFDAEECVFTSDGTASGGFLCEGTTANTNEQLYLFPASDGADTTNYVALGASDGDALAGDSATGFFDAGTVDDARIDGGAEEDEITHDNLGTPRTATALSANTLDATTEIAGTLCGTGEILEDQGASWACITTPSGAFTSFDVTDTDASPIQTVDDGEQVQFIGAGTVSVDLTADASNHDVTITGSAHTVEVNDLSAAVTWTNVPDANVDGSAESDEVTMGGDLSGAANAATINADVVDFDNILQSNTLAGNPALAVDECYFIATIAGGGFICEGSTADTSEQLYLFPDQNGADTTQEITLNDATQTLTNKSISGEQIDSGTIPAARVGASHIDTLTEIDSTLKSGLDSELLTGTIATTNAVLTVDANDDVVEETNGLTWNITPATCTGDGNGGALTVSGTTIVCSADDGGAGGSPGGSDTQVQFNDGGSTFGGDPGFLFDKTLDELTLGQAGTQSGRIALADSASNKTCVAQSGDRIFHDTDCDNTKDAGEEFIDISATAVDGAYDPDTKPQTCAACEEFSGDTEDLSWAWGNQGSATQTLTGEASRISILTSSGPERRGRWYSSIPTANDWTITTKVSIVIDEPATNGGIGGGLWFLDQGSIATPTDISMCRVAWSTGSDDTWIVALSTATSYTSSYTTPGTVYLLTPAILDEVYVQARYVVSTNVLTCLYSFDGRTWTSVGTDTLTNDPTTGGYWIDHSNSGSTTFYLSADYWRLRTDAAGLAGQAGGPSRVAGMTVAEVDGTPSVDNVIGVEFDQTDGFTVTDNADGTVQIDLVDAPDAAVSNTLTHSGGSIAMESLTVTAVADDEVLVGTGVGTAAFTALQNCNDTTEKLDWNGTAFSCITDQTGGGGGDSIQIEDGDNLGTFTAIDTTANFDDSGDINFTFADGGAGGPDVVTATVRADSVALTTDTSGDYVQSVADGTGIDGTATGEGSTYTPTLDLTEIDTPTWSDNTVATVTQTFDPTGTTNPVWSYSDGVANLSTGTLQAGGVAVSTGSHFSPTAGIDTDHGAGAIDATTDFAAALCGTNEILEDQGATWACIATPGGGGNSFGIVTDGTTPATSDTGNDTLTVTDSTTIDFVTSDAPEDLTASVVANSLDQDELAATITFADGDLVDFGTFVSSATEGLMLPANATSCATASAEAQACWEEDANVFWIGGFEQVGTTASQTLSNKTLTSPTIGNLSNMNHQHNSASAGGTLDGSAILNNSFDYSHQDYSGTLAADWNFAAEECWFSVDGTGGGGFLCEGTTANTSEQLYLFPAVDGADTTVFIATDPTQVTDLEGTGLTISGGALTADLGTLIEEVEMASEDFGDFSCGAGADDCLLDTGVVDSTAILDDGVNTGDLDDGADTPSEGQVLAVAATTTDIAYVSPMNFTKTLFDKTSGIEADDDIPDIIIWEQAAVVNEVSCIVSGGTNVVMTLEDDAGNDLTTSCTCTTSLTTCTLTGNTAYSANERMDLTVVSISGTNTSFSFTVGYDYDL